MNNFYRHGASYGKISDNKDPDKFGRVKVKLEGMGDDIETNWIPVLNLYASSKLGTFYIPEVDDQVVVGFMNDNPDSGIVLCSIWSDNQTPPETSESSAGELNKDGKNNLRFIKSRSGNQIILDDKDNEEKIQILTKDGKSRFEFLGKDKKINVETDKDFNLSSGKKLGIEADEIEIKYNKGAKIEADVISMSTKSQSIEIKASQKIKIDGMGIKLN